MIGGYGIVSMREKLEEKDKNKVCTFLPNFSGVQTENKYFRLNAFSDQLSAISKKPGGKLAKLKAGKWRPATSTASCR